MTNLHHLKRVEPQTDLEDDSATTPYTSPGLGQSHSTLEASHILQTNT